MIGKTIMGYSIIGNIKNGAVTATAPFLEIEYLSPEFSYMRQQYVNLDLSIFI